MTVSFANLSSRIVLGLRIVTEPCLPTTIRFDPIKIRRVLVLSSIWWIRDGEFQRPNFQNCFVNLDETSVRPTEGEQNTGLGLATAKKSDEQQGGEISFKNRVGVGSRFSFWLPPGRKPENPIDVKPITRGRRWWNYAIDMTRVISQVKRTGYGALTMCGAYKKRRR